MYMVSDRFKVSLFDIHFTTFCLFVFYFIYLFIYLLFLFIFSCLCCCFVFESNKTDIETWVEVWENETETA